jgi:hypothetical protein
MAIAVVLSIASIACPGGSKIEGTYSRDSGTIVLDLKSGGKASLTLMGEMKPCTYKVDGQTLRLKCEDEDEETSFNIHDDGSLSGPGFIGMLRKSKS